MFEQLSLALKSRGFPEFTAPNIYFLLFRNIEQLARAFPEKQRCSGNFTVLNIRYTFRIFEQLALALKNRVAQKFFAVWNILLHSEFLTNLRLP